MRSMLSCASLIARLENSLAPSEIVGAAARAALANRMHKDRNSPAQRMLRLFERAFTNRNRSPCRIGYSLLSLGRKTGILRHSFPSTFPTASQDGNLIL